MSRASRPSGIVQLKVSVEDTGIGIPADKLSTVFEKFAQVDGSSTRRHEGTGLGLAIAARLVDLMGGTIGLESEVGRGSIFWFTAPMPAHAANEPEAIVPVDVTGARVLVIDDNPVNREILLEQLRGWGFDCAAADSGAIGLAFLDRAAQLGANVDCVILDYQMPGMSGAGRGQGHARRCQNRCHPDRASDLRRSGRLRPSRPRLWHCSASDEAGAVRRTLRDSGGHHPESPQPGKP